MLNFFSKFLDANEREIGRLKKIVDQINSLEPKTKKLTDAQIKNKTLDLKKRFQKGESLDSLLQEAFALAREASIRALKMRHYDVQLMAATALHEGKIAEQKTGEGKTLTAVPAVFLNALSGKGVHVVTVNDYLAKRDCGWNGPIYHQLGISVAVIVHETAFMYDPKFKNPEEKDPNLRHLRPVTRKEAYAADITYGTNNEFGFDYLRDNMASSLDAQVQRGHQFAIVDEVDSILIDEARTPLIISAPSSEPTDKYVHFTQIISKLGDSDYVIDEKQKTVHLTETGVVKIEKILGVENLYERDFATLHHIEEALKAKTLFQKDRDYVIQDGQVVIVDENTGRLKPGQRYSGGLHQAIESKEGVTIQQETKTWATISLQNYFRMYEKLAGMTGTAATEAEEFFKIYKLEVVIIPTNKPMTRVDHSDSIFKNQTAKYNAVAAEIEKINQTGQPVLIGTTSVEKNEFLSELLKRKKISHALLNAKNHQREAEIISEAGLKGAVTVATNLAGRGVDIKLGKGVEALGGLYVIGTERHESRRIDNQLRGRSGRQGDPGQTKFFVSLEDDLMRIFGGEQVSKVMNFLKVPEDMPIENNLVSKAIEGAQKKVEGHNFDIRKYTVEYDDVMNQQRQIIYGVRNQVLAAIANKNHKEDSGLREMILEKVDAEISKIVQINSVEEINKEQIVSDFSTIILFDDQSKGGLLEQVSKLNSAEEMTDFLIKLARDLYQLKEQQVGADMSRDMENFVYLNTIDTLWTEHIDIMDDLRSGIGLRAYAQREPLIEYKKEGFELFERLIQNIDSEIVYRIFKLAPQNASEIAVPAPVIDVSKSVATHEEALDEDLMLEKAGSLIPQNPESFLSGSEVQSLQNGGETKVTVERDGQIVSEETYGGNGALQTAKVGRNDPCPCGSGLKWKKCGLINAPQHKR